MIGIHDPWITEREKEAVSAALASGWISGHGEFIPKFERELASALGLGQPVVSTVNGSAALLLALRALSPPPGFRALLCDYGFVATANAVVYAGGVPVFLGPDRADDPAVSAERIEERLEKDPTLKAVVYNQPYGFSADMARLRAACDRRGVLLVEDSSQALGLRQHGRMLGTFGHAGCWSMNGNKTVTTGMGGALRLESEELAARARRLRIHGRNDPFDFHYEELGYNFQLSNVLAALGCAQLSRLPEILASKEAVRARYAALFAARGRRLAGPASSPAWLNLLWLEKPRDRAFFRALAAATEAEGVQLRPAFPPVTSYPMYASAERHGTEHSASFFERSFCLPSGPGLTPAQVERAAEVVHLALERLDA